MHPTPMHLPLNTPLMAIDKASPISLLILLLLSAATTTHSCHPVDKQALLHYKSTITADPSKLLKTWNSTTDCCSAWAGVACDSHSGRVVNVSMSCLQDGGEQFGPIDTSMNGSISPFLGNLSSLQLLDLSACKNLAGPVPSELGKLAALKFLFLNDNQLTGAVPISFRRLTHLKRFYLSNNAMSGSLPSIVFAKLTKLAELSLSGNRFSGRIPSICKMGLLTLLDLHQNKLSGRIPSDIGYLKNLNSIDLSSNKLSGSIPAKVLGLRSLKVFDVSNNRLSGRIPAHKANLPASGFEGNPGLCGTPLPACK